MTIRKKFVKSANTEVVEEHLENRKDLEKENRILKEKMKEVETNFAILKVENDEMDIKNEVLEKDKYLLEQELEEAYSDSRELNKNIDNVKKSKYKSDESIEELNKKVLMLENVGSNRDTEIHLLREKFDSFEASTSPEATTSCSMCK